MDSRPITIRLTLSQVLLIARALKSQGENELAERFESLYQRMASRSDSNESEFERVMEFFRRWIS